MLHLVHFEEQESPARLDIEVYSREPSRCKCADIHYELTRKSDAHVDEDGCDGVLVAFASWLGASMHRSCVPSQILFSLTRVPARRAGERLNILMTKEVSLQDPLICEPQSADVANVCAGTMLFLHM